MVENRAVLREGFTGQLWRSIEDIYTQIRVHPFLAGLTDGTLAEERFRFYVLQRPHVTLALSFSTCLCR